MGQSLGDFIMFLPAAGSLAKPGPDLVTLGNLGGFQLVSILRDSQRMLSPPGADTNSHTLGGSV